MITIPPAARILVARRPVDFRRGHDGLAAMVAQALGEDPFCGTIFVFRSKRMDRVKILVWDDSGLWVHHKRLEQGRFSWPEIEDGAVTLTAAQLTLLLGGLEWRRAVAPTVRRPGRAG